MEQTCLIRFCTHSHKHITELTHGRVSQNTFDICLNQGVIETPMIFLRAGSNNVLYPMDSDKAKAAVPESKYFKKVSRKELQVGDVITLVGDDTKRRYLGTWHTLEYRDSLRANYSGNNNGTVDVSFEGKDKTKSKRLAFFEVVRESDKTYYQKFTTYSSPKVNEVLEAVETPVSEADALAYVQKLNLEVRGYDTTPAYSYVGIKPLTLKDAKVHIVPVHPEVGGVHWNTTIDGLVRYEGEEEIYHLHLDDKCAMTLYKTEVRDICPGVGVVVQQKTAVRSSSRYVYDNYTVSGVVHNTLTLPDPLAHVRPAVHSYWYPSGDDRETLVTSYMKQLDDMKIEFLVQQLSK